MIAVRRARAGRTPMTGMPEGSRDPSRIEETTGSGAWCEARDAAVARCVLVGDTDPELLELLAEWLGTPDCDALAEAQAAIRERLSLGR